MSVKVMNMVWQHSQLKGSALLLLLAIADNANDAGEAYPSVDTLAQKIRMSARQVQRLIPELERRGELVYVKGGGRGRMHYFAILLDALKPRLVVTDTSDNPRQDVTLSENKRRQDVTDYQTERVTFEQERVTSEGLKGDISGTPPTPPYKAEPLEPSLEPKPTTTTARASDDSDPFETEAVKLYVKLMRPEPGLAIHQAELIASEVSRLDIWRNVLVLFAGNEHRGSDGTARRVGYALDRYRREVEKADSESPKVAAGVNRAPRADLPPELSPDELQTQVNIVAAMLDDGRTLPEIHAQIGRAIRQSQWGQIASAARAQAKPPKFDTAGESPPPVSANVVNMPNRMQAKG